MRQTDGVVTLRDLTESDIRQRIYWETAETEWQRWDGPWEYENQTDAEKWTALMEYIRSLRQRLARLQSMPDSQRRYRFEIDAQGEYIGWCSAYWIDEDCCYAGHGTRLAVGIDLPAEHARGKGYAVRALRLMIDYQLACGEGEVYTQTWSGNERMLGLAAKLGFEEYCRKPGLRLVRGRRYDGLTLRLNMERYRARAADE